MYEVSCILSIKELFITVFKYGFDNNVCQNYDHNY